MNKKQIMALTKRGLKASNSITVIRKNLGKNTKDSATKRVMSELDNISTICVHDPYNWLFLDDYVNGRKEIWQYEEVLKNDKLMALVLFLRLFSLCSNHIKKQQLNLKSYGVDIILNSNI